MDISLVEGCHRLPCSFITYNYEMDKVQLREDKKMPRRGVEPPRPCGHRPSTCRVFQFRHRGSNPDYILTSTVCQPLPSDARLHVSRADLSPAGQVRVEGDAKFKVWALTKARKWTIMYLIMIMICNKTQEGVVGRENA